MKKLLCLVAVAAMFAAVPLSHAVAGNGKKAAKVKVCHVTSLNDAGTHYLGHVIEVNGNAVSAHCKHGDHTPGAAREAGDDCRRRPGRAKCDGNATVTPNWDK